MGVTDNINITEIVINYIYLSVFIITKNTITIMGNIENTQSEPKNNVNNEITQTVKVILTWIPSALNKKDNKSLIELETPINTIKIGFWKYLKEILVNNGKSDVVRFSIENVLTKYEEGKPVYSSVWIGDGSDEISSRYLLTKNHIEIIAFESND